MTTPPALVADIGGTNTRVALADGAALHEGSVRRYRNADHGSLESVLRAYLDEAGNPALSGGCVAVAGPVRDGVGKLTNLDWQIDTDALTRACGTGHVAILNDLQAQGHALDHLAPGALSPILPRGAGHDTPGAARLVIGIGTGFNAAGLFPAPNGGLIVTAAEAGHAALPVETEDDLALARYVRGADGFAAVEDVLSGRGLAHVYGFVTARQGREAQLDGAGVMAAVRARNADAVAALGLFTRYLGIVAGNLALNFLPFGGICLCGGVARGVAPHLGDMGFEAAFRGKGRFSGMMQEFALSLIEDDFAALAGCAAYLHR